ncbi:MAG TPA: iron ABC transporter permease [Actinophytocola sp.]|jgi:iron(III) transport system permease protein|nr:iron ABC transporter permease [Actinophytocola sp.]
MATVTAPEVREDPASGETGLRRRARSALQRYPLPLVTALVLAVLVLPPLGWLLVLSTRVEGGGGLTLANFATVLSDERYLGAIGRSLYIGWFVGVLCIVLSAPAAWAVAKTDMPGRTTVRVLIVGSFVLPSFLGALAWILLAGPNAGILNRVYRAVTGASSGLFNIYTLGGLIFVITMSMYPLCFLLLSTALENVPADSEDAATILGASGRKVALSITIPLVTTAVLGGFILVFLEAISVFGPPAMLAIPSGFHVITTQIYALLQYPQHLELAAALSMPLLLITLLLVWLQRRFIGRRGYVTVTGKSGARRAIALGKWKWLAVGYCWLLIVVSLVLPVAVLLWVALSKSWGQGFGLSNLTLDNFRYVLFDYRPARSALFNSLTLAILAATAASVLAALISYVTSRRLVRGHQILPVLTMAPVVLPGLVLAVGLFMTYARPPFVLYGTIWVLFIAFVTKFLPYAYINTSSAISSLDTDLEDAGRIMGATRTRTLARIVFPLMKGGIMSAWILVFMVSLHELSASVLLYTSKSRVLSIVLLDLQSDGRYEDAAVVGILLLAVTLVIVGIGYRVIGKDIVNMRTN